MDCYQNLCRHVDILLLPWEVRIQDCRLAFVIMNTRMPNVRVCPALRIVEDLASWHRWIRYHVVVVIYCARENPDQKRLQGWNRSCSNGQSVLDRGPPK